MSYLEFEELSYASPDDPVFKRWLIHAVEHLSGRPKLLPLYKVWRVIAAKKPDHMMRELLKLIELDAVINGKPWPPAVKPSTPLVMIANHPFGIGDGIIMLAMAEEIGRPYRVFVDRRLLKIPEIRPYALPIDHANTRQAVRMNLHSRQLAREFLSQNHTVIIFPAGAVATARWPFGRARELPWKNFAARLIQGAEASVLPVYFDGQNSPLFHLVSRFSMTLRISLIVSEFIRRFRRSRVRVTVGAVVPFSELEAKHNGRLLTAELFRLVEALEPQGAQIESTKPG